MKPKFFLCLLISALSFSAFAQKSLPQEKTPRTIHFKEVFTNVSIDDDVNVILTEGSSDKIIVEGDVKATITDGHLYVAARNPRLAYGMKVYIPASFLTKVYMNGNGSLTSANILSNQKMKIYLTAEAKIHVRSTGNVTIETVDDIQFIKGR
ncbi:MAG TPA: DUF2807 domain-containing protein [Flavisolibacter sp.]|nr:DUF2807 domain-containing protein [Flavisolibacter sp.]